MAFAKGHAAAHGIKLGSVEVDLPTMLKRKDEVVAKNTGGLTLLAKARKVAVLTGEASFTSATTVAIKGEKGTTEVTAKNIVIATGSAPVELPFMKFDGKTVVSSDHAIA